MNGTDRLERELTTWFAETAPPQTPDWTADILAATGTMRQRPRWSFPTRWLPAAVVPRLPRLTLRPVPWRTIALLARAGPAARRRRGPLRGQPAAPSGTVRTCGERPRRLCRARRDLDRRPGHRSPEEDRDPDRRQRLPRASPGRDAPRVLAAGRPAGNRSRSRTQTAVAWSSRRARRSSNPTPTRSPGRRTVASSRSSPGRPRGRAPRTTYLVDTTTGEVRDLDTPGVDTEVYWRPPDGRQLMYNRDSLGRQTSVPRLGRERRGDRDGCRESGGLPYGPVAGRRMGSTSSSTVTTTTNDRAWTELLDPETGSDEPARGRVRPSLERRETNRRASDISGDLEAPSASCLSRKAGATRLRSRASRPTSSTTPACSGRPTIDGSSCTPRTRAWLGPARPRGRTADHAGLVGARASNRGSAWRRDGAAGNPPGTSERIGGRRCPRGNSRIRSAGERIRPAFHDRGDSDG